MVRVVLKRVLAMFGARRGDAHFDAEIREHLDRLTEDHVRRGLEPAVARAAARRDFGGVDQIREQYRDQRGLHALDLLAQDVRYALRQLRRSPGFTAAVAVTIALGVGANTALFSLVYGILMRPLDYRDARQLVAVRVEREFAGRATLVAANFPYRQIDVFRARARSLESAAMIFGWSAAVKTDAGNEVVDVAVVSDNFFHTLDGRLRAGRGLGSADHDADAVVISERLGRRRFGASASAIGQTIVLNDRRFSIVGVASDTFQVPSDHHDIWASMAALRVLAPETPLDSMGGQIVGRLSPGADMHQTQREVDDIARIVDARLHMTPVPLRDWRLASTLKPALTVLAGAAMLVLFVACINVTNLMLARDASRERETAVRLALGASRWRLLSQSLAHAGMMTAIGSGAGVLLAATLVDAFVRMKPAGLTGLDAVHVDAPVLLFALAVAAITTGVVGTLPVWQSVVAAASLRGGVGLRRGRRIRTSLVVAELAVSVVLLVGASLFGRSFVRLLDADIGIQPDRVTAALVGVFSFGRTMPMAERDARIAHILDGVRALPGVAVAGAGSSLPPSQSRLRFTMDRADIPGKPANYMVDAVAATPEYFAALGTRLRYGRFFTRIDDARHPPVMIMTATTARQMFGDDNPVGRSMRFPILSDRPTPPAAVTLVGVIDDVKYTGLDAAAQPVVYRPFAQQPVPTAFVVVRTALDSPSFAATLSREIAKADPDAAIYSSASLDSTIANAAAPQRLRAVVLIGMAALAAGLAIVGLYGIVSYAVAQRTAEIGVRMALGAGRADILRLVFREGLVLAVAGIGIGVPAARVLAGVMATLLYGVKPADPLSFAGAALLLAVVTVVACIVPAARAARISPLSALKCD